jgi:hypothetical protein
MKMSLPVLSEATLIATDEYPLRASALPKINDCPASVFLQQSFWIESDDDEPGGEAAQTGNLLHSGAADYHRLKMMDPAATEEARREVGLKALEEARAKFPGGDLRRAKKHYEAYVADPKNQEATVIRCEEKVRCELPPAPFDPTGRPVVIRGTLDQLRLVDGTLQVYDIKTGKAFYGWKALDHYMTQQAAYVLAAKQTYGKDHPGVTFEPGGLICTEGYVSATASQVYWFHKWSFDDIPLILQNVVNQVAAARMQRLGFTPSSDACRWCEHKNFSNCTSFFKDHVH